MSVDTNLTFKKCQQNNDVSGTFTVVSASNRLPVFHTGFKNGFFDGAGLTFKPETANEDCHGQMNSANFEKWLNEKSDTQPAPELSCSYGKCTISWMTGG
jgi:hypothetical protein